MNLVHILVNQVGLGSTWLKKRGWNSCKISLFLYFLMVQVLALFVFPSVVASDSPGWIGGVEHHQGAIVLHIDQVDEFVGLYSWPRPPVLVFQGIWLVWILASDWMYPGKAEEDTGENGSHSISFHNSIRSLYLLITSIPRSVDMPAWQAISALLGCL